jgi:hypothetical protein
MRKRVINTAVPAEWGGLDEALNMTRVSRTSIYRILGRRLINLKSLGAYLSKMSKAQAQADKSVALSGKEVA